MLKMKRPIIILIVILLALMTTASSCLDFIKPNKGLDAIDLVDEMIDESKTGNEEQEADEPVQEEDAGPPPYVPQVPAPFTELFDNLKSTSLDWGFNSLYPAAQNDDRAKVVFTIDPLTGQLIYSIEGQDPGLYLPQVDQVGWGNFMLQFDDSWSGPPPDVVFPCDQDINDRPPDQDWFTICPEGAGPSDAQSWYIVYTVFAGPIPSNDPDHSYTYAAVFDADGILENNFQYMEPYNWDYWQNTDQWYILDWMNNTQQWQVNVRGLNGEMLETDSRAVVYGDMVLWTIAASDFPILSPGGRVSSFATTGGWNAPDVGGDVNGETPKEPLTPLSSDPIHVMDPPFTEVGIVLDGWDTCGSGQCKYNEKIVQQQKTEVWCTDNGCSKLNPPGKCALFSRAKGDSPQDPESWSYVADPNVKIQKNWALVYHCFCVK